MQNREVFHSVFFQKSNMTQLLNGSLTSRISNENRPDPPENGFLFSESFYFAQPVTLCILPQMLRHYDEAMQGSEDAKLAYLLGFCYNKDITLRGNVMGRKYTEEELNSCSKEMLITLLLSMQDQLDNLNTSMERMVEQIAIMNSQHFGRKTEKLADLSDQLSFFDFNEIEATVDKQTVPAPEPDINDIKQTSRKPSGKRETDLKGLPVEVVSHDLTDEQKQDLGADYKTLPDEIYRRLKVIPRQVIVEEHHVAVYSTKEDKIVKASHPAFLLRNSLASPSLVSAIMHEKFVNAVPLYRQEQELNRCSINLSRQVMANWCIQCSDRYLALMYDRLKNDLIRRSVLQVDETPVEVTKDGRPTGSKSYMWVYRTGAFDRLNQIVLYDYQKGRNHEHPETFLNGFSGTVVCDGFSAYNVLDKTHTELTLANCWAHLRRRFAEACKAIKSKDAIPTSVAGKAIAQIAAIYKLENELADLSSDERLERRITTVKPLIEAFFAWVQKQTLDISVPPKSKTADGLSYALKHQKELMTFLSNGNVPIDNNATERALRSFTIGRSNWRLIDTINGAKSSAVIYSLVETAKFNSLNPRKYLEYLLTEIPEHQDDTDLSFLEELLPWSDQVIEKCKV